MRDPFGLWDETYGFLTELFSPYKNGFIELRYRDPLERMRRDWFSVADTETASDRVYELDAEGCEVYFGVLPRDSTNNGRKANISQAAWIWADIDYKETPRDKAEKALEKCPPDIRIKSGGGLHVYWKLDRVISLADAGVKKFETALAKRVASIGGDPSGKDVSRLLRVPGTLNRKYSPPRKVRRIISPNMPELPAPPPDTTSRWEQDLANAQTKCEAEWCRLQLTYHTAKTDGEHIAALVALDNWRLNQAAKRDGLVAWSKVVDAKVVIVEAIPYIPAGEPVIFERKELELLDNYGPDAVKSVWNVKRHFGGKWVGAVEEICEDGC